MKYFPTGLKSHQISLVFLSKSISDLKCLITHIYTLSLFVLLYIGICGDRYSYIIYTDIFIMC